MSETLAPRNDAEPRAAAPSAAAPTVYLETFGCQMNVLDSQLVTGQLKALGYRFVEDWKAADVVLYNTCSVREMAENKVWSRVGIVGKYKQAQADEGKSPGVLGVIGCMAERDGTDMLRKHPQIDLLCGPGELDRVPMLVDNALKTRLADPSPTRAPRDAQVALQGNTHRRSATLSAASDRLELVDLSRAFAAEDTAANGRSAYVRITRGCNKLCTYCVVPHTRGAEVHRPPDHIVEECKKLEAAGVREITLLGQTVNHYHYDTAAAVTIEGVLQPQVGATISPNAGNGGPSPTFGPTTVSFAQLLRRIHDECPGVSRLRFVTSLPRDFGNDILETIRGSPRICRYLHLPVQSGSDRVLRKMNRGYKAADFFDLIDRARRILPDCEIATDLICGFPGETEEDHELTKDLLRRCRFKNAFIFKYSPRPGTIANDRLEDDIPDAVKRRRNNELLEIQSEVSAKVHAAYPGKTVQVFVESVSAKATKAANGAAPGSPEVSLGWQQPTTTTQLTGRTGGDLIVMFDGDPTLIGEMATVEITSAAPLTLFGRLSERQA
ncbi:MAG: MiaB/RimO family radical SAM methylthiotransferase [Planctomycetota bacterium]